MKLRNLILRISHRFPKSLCEPWDFSGYQVGPKNRDREVHSVLLCLDFTECVMKKAREVKPDLILTHHPFLFGKKKEVLREDPLKEKLVWQVETSLQTPIYSFHTNFDSGKEGMNDTILHILGCHDIRVSQDGIMRIASLSKPTDIQSLASKIQETFSLPYVFYHSGTKKTIQSLALIAGGGSEYYREAMKENADVYISGDCPHHTRVDIKRYDYNYIDVSHEIEETGFLVGMENALRSIGYEGEVIPFAYEKDFEVIL